MRELTRDTLRGFALITPLLVLIGVSSYANDRKLREAERYNRVQHTRSLEDRAVIHKLQDDILRRLVNTEKAVAGLAASKP